MPSLADITVKANDNSTDVVWSGLVSAGSDLKSAAVWRSNTAVGTPGQRPEVRLAAAQAQDNASRKMVANYTYPEVYTESDTGLTKVRTRWNATVTISVPLDMGDVHREEAAAQFGNLLASSLIEACMTSGYSAN